MPDHNPLILTTPYNFVPLSSKVVRPHWAHLISHDKPFKDGLSGQLKLSIKAEQPIFTRNSVGRRITDPDQVKEAGSHFSQKPDGKYFLPGSSIKGAIRNVLEIMSFGDLAKGLNEEIWALRDLTLQSYKDLFTWDSKVHCGWLHKNGEGYQIDDCGLPYRITHEQIDSHFKSKILANWAAGFEKSKEPSSRGLAYNFSKGTAEKKRSLFRDKNLNDTFTTSDGEQVEGELVFTGQPTIKYGEGNKGTIKVGPDEAIKYKEFIFGKTKVPLDLDDEVVKAFEFAHERLYLKNDERIPVFFHKNDNGGVASFGLAYMYKIPFTHSVKDAIERYQKDSGRGDDMAACIFGHVDKSSALRGRVTFGHAMTDGQSEEMPLKSEVLNSPKATYYPTYIRQSVKPNGKLKGEQYKTLFDKDAVPAGWKRYPIHSDRTKENPGPLIRGQRNEKIQAKFRPLPAGTTFTCTVNYHNLTKIELGALLSALTFHKTEGCYHSFGMAKPLGYGKCSVTITDAGTTPVEECLCIFEQFMEAQLARKGGWLQSDQMRELLSMSSDQDNKGRSMLEYMKEVKDFAKAKKEQLALDCYTKLEGVKSIIPQGKCPSEQPVADTKHLTGRAPQEIFKQKKAELLQRVHALQNAAAVKEQKTKEESEQRLREAERLRIQREKEEETERKEKERVTTELATGINLNGVQANKTIDGLLRVLKRWTENMGGNLDKSLGAQIQKRFDELYGQVKQREKQSWLQKLKADLPKLNEYLSDAQIMELEAHLDEFL